MTPKQYTIISLCTLLLGILLFAYQKEYIILNLKPKTEFSETHTASLKKNSNFYYWHHNEWHTDQNQLLFSDNIAANMQQLISRWLQLIHEEGIIKKKVILQAALLNYDGTELFLSFDRAPWNKESTTFEKWMAIEGILKTVKKAEPSIKKVQFLQHHQPLKDTHLDFIRPWPIDGFIA